MDETTTPVSKTASVPVGPLEAFEIFTSHLSLWWPLEEFSVRGADAETCIFELWEGGELFELAKGSERLTWGRVVEFDPPRGFVITWHPGRDPKTAQRIQVKFRRISDGDTEMTLLHSGWDALGDEAGDYRSRYEAGWDVVLQPYLELAREEASKVV